MNIVEITKKLDELAISHDYDIAQLQSFRKIILGRVGRKTIFSHNKKAEGRLYSFHSGGRKELQFNLGEDIIEGKKVFRYGVVYSLERSRSLHTLMADLNPSRKRFNDYVASYPNILDGCQLWYDKNNEWGGFINDNLIKDEIFKDNNFIFIGKYLNKTLDEVTVDDLHLILKQFDIFFPLYKFCLDETATIKQQDKRIMRLTWNSNNWETPCGHKWDTKNQKNSSVAHENQYGYGHEEWLLNERFRIDGYQYGYIRGVNNLSADTEKIDQITLYTIRNDKQRCLVGNLHDVEIIEGYEEEQKKIENLISAYKGAMTEELETVRADFKHFTKDQLLPNVKFKWNKADIFLRPIPVDFLNGADFNRFQAYKLKTELAELIQSEFKTESKFIFQHGKASNTGEYTKTSSSKKTKVKRRHGEITDNLYDYLISKGIEKKNISVEKTRVGGAIVDVALKVESGFELFEVKTSNTALKNIREALGQILEYALLDGEVNCNRLVIVGSAVLTNNEKEYLERLKALMNIKLEYWGYKAEEKLIENKFVIE